jgi:uncharacterized spore protein YtfJ
MGAGYGGGGGVGQDNDEGETAASGFGGGGGGTAMARPVAAIIIEPEGVRVEPIQDPTKLAVAFFTTFISMLMTLTKLRKSS